MFLALIFGFIAGAFSVIAVNIFIIYYWLKLQPKQDPKLVPEHVRVRNPKQVSDYCSAEGATSSESCMFFNLVIAFLWKEWRDTTKTKSYFIKKMNLEFQELLLNKAGGKLLQQISVKDFCLGDSLPVIKKATVMKIQSRGADQVAQELDIALDIEYSGGFHISLDADLIFGKTAYMAVKLNSLKGRLRLQFTRIPCTHWSFSFYEDPEMSLDVESQFNGKNLARLTSLIKNQIKKSIKRKHTLPRYKVRYKPFFQQPISHDGKNEVFVHNSRVTVGKLDVEVLDCSRLSVLPISSQLYCNISIDSLPWSEVMPKRSASWPVHEVTLTRTISGSIGVSIKQSTGTQEEEHRQVIIIDTITPQSPASAANIQRGDILLAVNEVEVESIKQTVKLIKNSGDKINFKLQRPPSAALLNAESQDVLSDGDSKEEDVTASTETQKTDFENSFNFDNVTLDTDDSDGEEFVNIVVQELEQQIPENDENARKILRKFSLSSKKGKIPEENSTNIQTHEIITEEEEDEITNAEPSSAKKDDKKNNKPKNDKTNNTNIDNEIDRRNSSKSTENKDENSTLKQKKRTFSLKKPNHAIDKDKVPENEATPENEAHKKPADRISMSRKILHNKDQSIDIDSDSSDSSSETGGDGGWDNISQHTLLNRDANEKQTSQKTSCVCSSGDPVWNESFSFEIEKQHKFVNLCVWSKCEEREQKDILLGYASISLMELALECLSTTSHKHVQSYFLTPPYNRSSVSRANLRFLLPGLKSETCNGDITLAFCYKPNLQNCFLTGEELHEALEGYVDKSEEIREDQSLADNDGKLNTERMHDFMGTQFHFSTRCDYCQKKVWTKTASQCRVCAMICHNKCVSNAHSNTYCTRMGVRAKPPAWQEEDSAKKQDGVLTKEPSKPKDPETISLKVPDVDRMRPSMRSKSFSSPQILRRRVFRHPTTKDEGEIEHPLQKSVDTKELDSIATAAVTAKKAGKELFSSLDQEDRRENIEKMVQKMQGEIDAENEKRTELCLMLNHVSDAEQATKLQSSMRKSEERSQALSLLMIQYCAALEECLKVTDNNEKPKCT